MGVIKMTDIAPLMNNVAPETVNLMTLASIAYENDNCSFSMYG